MEGSVESEEYTFEAKYLSDTALAVMSAGELVEFDEGIIRIQHSIQQGIFNLSFNPSKITNSQMSCPQSDEEQVVYSLRNKDFAWNRTV